MTQFNDLLPPLIGTVISYLPPPEVKRIAVHRSKDKEIQAIIYEFHKRYFSMHDHQLWKDWVGAYQLPLNDRVLPIDIVKRHFAKINKEAIGFVINAVNGQGRQPDLDWRLPYKIEVLVDPISRYRAMQEHSYVFLFGGELLDRSSTLDAMESRNVPVVRMYLEALFPDEALRREAFVPDN